MLARFRKAVVKFARDVLEGVGLPGLASRLWQPYLPANVAEKIDVMERANDVAAASQGFESLGHDLPLAAAFPKNYPGNEPGHVGPADQPAASLWFRVGIPIDGETHWFSKKLESDWRADIGQAWHDIQSAIDEMGATYFASGTYEIGTGFVAEIVLY